MRYLIIFAFTLSILSNARSQGKNELVWLKEAFTAKDQLPDSIASVHIDSLFSTKDSFLIEKGLSILDKEERKLSASSLIEICNKEISFFTSKEREPLWRKTIEAIRSKADRDTISLAFAINSLGEYFVSQQRDEDAISEFIEAISLFPENSLVEELGYSYNNLGVLLERKGDIGASLPYKKRSLEIFTHFLGADHPYMGTLNNNVGMSYQTLKQYEDAQVYMHRAEESINRHSAPCSNNHYMINNNLGINYRRLKDFEKAEEYIQKALDCIGEENMKSDPRYVKLLSEMISNKDANNAEYSDQDIINLYRNYINKARRYLGDYHLQLSSMYNNFGVLLYGRGKALESTELFEAFIYSKYPETQGKDFLNYIENTTNKNKLALLDLLINLGSAQLEAYRETRDTAFMNKSLRVFKSFDKIAGSLRPEIISGRSRHTLKAKFKRGYVLHNRTLLDAYNYSEDVTKVYQIYQNLEKIQNWELLENFSFSQRSKLVSEGDLAMKIDSLKKAVSLTKQAEITEKDQLDLAIYIDQLKQEHPDYYEKLYGTEVASIKNLQSFCKENDQNWLFYFYISNGKYCSFLVRPDTVILGESFSLKKLSTAKKQIFKSFQNKDWEFVKESMNLYDTLIRPYQEDITSENLKIIPHTHLLDFPFSILIDRKKENDEKAFKYAYLLNDFSISYAYSATIAIKTFEKESNLSKPLFVAPTYMDKPLLYNEQEIRHGHKLLGGKMLRGNRALKQNLVSIMRKADHMHFAGHISSKGSIDSTFLVLNLEQDSLFLNEISALENNCDLVILSGCESGLGARSSEALISPAYGFTFAGSPNVISTMWMSNDESSSKIFADFYNHLEDKIGSIKAMQLAKLNYLETAPKPERHPSYWASYVYYGNDVYWQASKWKRKCLLSFFVLFLLIFGYRFFRSSQFSS